MDVFQGIIARNGCNLSRMKIKIGPEVLYCCWVLLSSLGVNNSLSTKKLRHPVCFCNILSAEGWTSMEVNFLFWWVPGYWMFPSRNWLSLFHSIDINSPCNCFRRASIQKSTNCEPQAASNSCASDKVAEAHTSSSGTYFQSILGIFKYHAEVTPVN